MKSKYIYILLLLEMIFLSACKEEFSNEGNVEDIDGKLTFQVKVKIPEMFSLDTRALLDGVADKPEGNYLNNLKLYMFVFEDNGNPHANYLRQLVYGKDFLQLEGKPEIENDTQHHYEDKEGNYSSKDIINFKVSLDGTAENAIIHLVATSDPNLEDQLLDVPDRSEFGIFGGAQGLYTSNKEAFWKRIDLNCSIKEENRTKIQTQLSHIQLVRNFLRITLKDGKGEDTNLNGWHTDAFIVVNSVDAGYIAAYNEHLGQKNEAGFVEFEKRDESGNYLGVMQTYDYLNRNEKYIPARHPASKLYNSEEELSWVSEFVNNGNMSDKYSFERSVQDNKKTFIIIKGHYGNNSEKRYFKLDIGTINDTYGIYETYQLIRNISYDITVKNVASNTGHINIESAIKAPPSNNISASVETRPLLYIEDGVDSMEVNFTTLVIINDENGNPRINNMDAEDVVLRWKYLRNSKSTNPTLASQEVKWDYPGYDLNFENGLDPSGIFKSCNNSTITPTAANPYMIDGEEWYGLKFKFNKPDDVLRQKTIRLYYPFGLTRDITFIMHKRWKFINTNPKEWSNVEVYPGAYSYDNDLYTMPYETLNEMRTHITPGYVGSQKGAQLTVMFELPADLPESIFPLDFTIGADRQNIENAYIGNASVTWGNSLFEDDPQGVGVQRIQFVKTVTWDYYTKHKIVCARFVTNNDVLSELTDQEKEFENAKAITRIRVTNPYFEVGQDYFERAAHEDVIDKTRTHWYWNFSYPEWATYFATYSDCQTDPTGWPDLSTTNLESNPHNLNNLNFGGYVHNGKDDYTNVSGTFLQPLADYSGVTRSGDNPEFIFNLEGSSETGLNATMIIEATPNRDRNYVEAPYKYDFYFRKVYVKLITKNHPEGYTISQNCDAPEGTYTSFRTRYRLDLNTLKYNFEIEPNDIVQTIIIWSEKRIGPSKSGANYSYLDGETRYYSIDFTLTPN